MLKSSMVRQRINLRPRLASIPSILWSSNRVFRSPASSGAGCLLRTGSKSLLATSRAGSGCLLLGLCATGRGAWGCNGTGSAAGTGLSRGLSPCLLLGTGTRATRRHRGAGTGRSLGRRSPRSRLPFSPSKSASSSACALVQSRPWGRRQVCKTENFLPGLPWFPSGALPLIDGPPKLLLPLTTSCCHCFSLTEL